jgi:hypothetical protein
VRDIVIFRRWRTRITRDRTVIALFPYQKTGLTHVNSYDQHGHGDAYYLGVIAQRPTRWSNSPTRTRRGHEPATSSEHELHLQHRRSQ